MMAKNRISFENDCKSVSFTSPTTGKKVTIQDGMKYVAFMEKLGKEFDCSVKRRTAERVLPLSSP